MNKISWRKPVTRGHIHPFDLEISEMESNGRTVWCVFCSVDKWLLKMNICDRTLSQEEAKQQVAEWVGSKDCAERLRNHKDTFLP